LTLPVFMIAKKINVRSETIKKALANLTVCGFGIYMVHYFFTGPSVMLVRLIQIPIPLQIPVAAVLAFTASWLLVRLIYRVGGRGAKYIAG
ncbi:MAG: acyltransferase, partial [Bacteroides reticulotermitis]